MYWCGGGPKGHSLPDTLVATRRAGPNGNLTHFFFLFFCLGRFAAGFAIFSKSCCSCRWRSLWNFWTLFSFPLSSSKSKIHRLYYRGALNHAQGVFLQLVDHHFASCLKTRIHYRSHTHAARLLFHYSTTPKTSQTHSIQQPCIYIHHSLHSFNAARLQPLPLLSGASGNTSSSVRTSPRAIHRSERAR